MSARATLVLVFATGCGFQSAPATGDGTVDAPVKLDAPPTDAAAPDASTDPFCIKDVLVTACLTTAPTQPLTLTGTIATDVGAAMCATNTTPDTSNVCIVAGTSITVAAGQTVSAHGARPLVLLASGTITVSGTIDVAGHLKGVPQTSGPAVAACKGSTASPASGGGAGGSFGSKGGNGGADSAGHPGGTSGSAVVPTALIGGCTGLAGNDTGGTGSPGKGGGAGGALGLFAKAAIVVDGAVNASGGGGGGATHDDHGGGGGGTGGMIVLDAPSVTGAGKLFANGGSGGEGAGGNSGADGTDPSDPSIAAAGGGGASTGGDGGNGAAKTAAAVGTAGNSGAGGGGGGGGLGVIRLFTAPAVASTLAISPGAK
jgi:hypothetical protein